MKMEFSGLMKMEGWSGLGSILATMVFARTILKDYFPREIYDWFSELLRRLFAKLSSYISVVIEENDGMRVSEVYEAVETYLSAKSLAAERLKLKKPENSEEFTFSMDKNQRIGDKFGGIKVHWTFHSIELNQKTTSFWYRGSDEKRYYELKFHKKHKDKIFGDYLPHVINEGKILELKSRHRKLYTNEYRYWTSVVFDHPATFDTLALEPKEKQEIKEDLRRFSRREKYYRQVGRAWKRGYLLYGPPGTGKSSMIAAMANFLEYDIYDLELTQVKNNTELRKLLIATTNKSIIVIEDIDCSLDLSARKKKEPRKDAEEKEPQKDAEEKEKPSGKSDESKENQDSKVTLSGVLNFTDGLWSCCGSERLFVFTTNHIDRLDPALLRAGRMDRHIELSFCTFGAFKILAHNYLSIEDHKLFPEIQDLMEVAQITPADVTEHLMKTSRWDSYPTSALDYPTSALESLIQALAEAKERRASAANSNGISEENGGTQGLD